MEILLGIRDTLNCVSDKLDVEEIAFIGAAFTVDTR